jgi:hypothetical protein
MISHHTLSDHLRRLGALGAAVLVLALSSFAASPQLHDWLHACDHADEDQGCPVTLFAGGVPLPVEQPAVAAPVVLHGAASAPAFDEVFLTKPRYLLQPERGPPVV